METAFRAFEAAIVDPSWSRLGPDYSDALIDRFDRHLAGRARVYEEAGAILAEPFLRSVVSRKNSALRVGERHLPDSIDESRRPEVHSTVLLNSP